MRVSHEDMTGLHLRAVRLIENRLAAHRGDLARDEHDNLLHLDLTECDQGALVKAVATVGASITVIVEEATGLPADVLFDQMREMLVSR